MSVSSNSSDGSEDDGLPAMSPLYNPTNLREYVERIKYQPKILKREKSFEGDLRGSASSSTSLMSLKFKKKEGSNIGDYDIHENSKQHPNGHLDPSKSRSVGFKETSDSTTGKNSTSTWERWWVTSPLWRRKLVFLMLLMPFLGIIHLCCAIAFFSIPIHDHDPYLCSTQKCSDLSDWVKQSEAHEAFNPCVNFYNFSCAKHKQFDKGDLFGEWYENFARLEADGENGESILANILAKPSDSDIMGQRIVKFYQVCMKMWQLDTLQLEKSYAILIQHVFKDFDLWGETIGTRNYELEYAAASMVNFLGDFGFFKTLAPVDYPNIMVYKWESFTNHMGKDQESNITKILPLIYNSLGIKNFKHRQLITEHLLFMGDNLKRLIHRQNTEYYCSNNNVNATALTTTDPNIEFDFTYPFLLAYYGKENIDMTSEPWKLKGDRTLNLKIDAQGGEPTNFGLDFIKEWNCRIQKRFSDPKEKKYVRSTYATLWSLRLLIELVHDADDKTATDFELTTNSFFKYFKAVFYGRSKESRCYQSLLDAMGYYPIFRYFKSDKKYFRYHKTVTKVVKHAANALLEQFRPVEEGGLPFISSRYRERMHGILSRIEAINVLTPIHEDDFTFTGNATSPNLAVGDSHIQNIIIWREFTFQRNKHFWLSKSPIGKLVWYKDFYLVDKIVAFASPSAAKISLLHVPPSIFVFPFWNNDMEIANYAGARVMVAKTLMKLLQYDYTDRNIDNDIRDKKNDGILYREGVVTDADYEPCEIVTYNWFHPSPDTYTKRRHSLTKFDPHFLAFRYGRRNYPIWEDVTAVEKGFGAFAISVALRTMLMKYFEEVVGFIRKRQFWTYNKNQQRILMNQRLINYENFSEAQLFFILNFRELCRSKVLEDVYYSHVMENIGALMEMEEFSDSWKCPPQSPMNPINKCFR